MSLSPACSRAWPSSALTAESSRAAEALPNPSLRRAARYPRNAPASSRASAGQSSAPVAAISRFGDAIEKWTGPVVLAILVLALVGYAYRVATWKARPALNDS